MDGQIVDDFADIRLLTYFYAAAATAVTYEGILAFPRELEYIWKVKRWSTPKVLYLLCRYYGIFIVLVNFFAFSRVQHSLQLCRAFLWFLVSGKAIILSFAVNVISLLRLHALYDRDRTFLILMSVGFVVYTGFETYFAVKFAQSLVESVVIMPDDIPLSSCVMQIHGQYATCLWVIVLVFSTLIFGLMFAKYLETMRSQCIPGERPSIAPLLRAFYSSGTLWYFTFVFGIAVHATVYFTLTGPLKLVAFPWLIVIQSVSGSRLVLDLRCGHQKGNFATMGGEKELLGSLDFGTVVGFEKPNALTKDGVLDLEA